MELIEQMDKMYGFDDSECRKLGIKHEKIKNKFIKKTVKKGFF